MNLVFGKKCNDSTNDKFGKKRDSVDQIFDES